MGCNNCVLGRLLDLIEMIFPLTLIKLAPVFMLMATHFVHLLLLLITQNENWQNDEIAASWFSNNWLNLNKNKTQYLVYNMILRTFQHPIR